MGRARESPEMLHFSNSPESQRAAGFPTARDKSRNEANQPSEATRFDSREIFRDAVFL